MSERTNHQGGMISNANTGAGEFSKAHSDRGYLRNGYPRVEQSQYGTWFGNTGRMSTSCNRNGQKLNAQRNALLRDGAPVEIIISIVLIIITYGVGASRIDLTMISTWSVASLVLVFARALLWRRSSSFGKNPLELQRFVNRYIPLIAVHGVLWGSVAPLFAMSGVFLGIFYPFLIAIVSAVSFAALSSSFRAVMAANIPLFSAVGLSYLFIADDGSAIALLVMFFGFLVLCLAYVVERTTSKAIKIRMQQEVNERLMLDKLDHANESEQRFRSIVEASNELTLIFSPDGRVLYASPASQAVLGGPPQAFIGKRTRDMIHKNDLDAFRQAGARALAMFGEAQTIPSISFIAGDGRSRILSGRLTNLMYQQGVEGFVFAGSLVSAELMPSGNRALAV